MKKLLIAGIVASFAAAPAAAMDLATFLRHADTLERMGARAIFASEGRLLMAELNQSNAALRAERAAARAAGRRPAYCPEGHDRADIREVVAALRRVPAERRSRIQLTDALRIFYGHRYPCPA